ncbi:MAG: hypothetical protein U0237_01140 [Thermoleophilia bacterium]
MQTPWTPGPAAGADGPLHAVATEFRVRGLGGRIAFLRRSGTLARQARGAEGFVGMRMEARILSGVFRTVSVWTSADAARAYARSGAHLDAMRATPAGAGSVGSWPVGPEDLPLPVAAGRPHLVAA